MKKFDEREIKETKKLETDLSYSRFVRIIIPGAINFFNDVFDLPVNFISEHPTLVLNCCQKRKQQFGKHGQLLHRGILLLFHSSYFLFAG